MEYPLIALGVVFASEIAAYFWHRIFAHTDTITLVKEMHDVHHNVIDDQAHGDFIYVCGLLVAYFCFLLTLYFYYYINVYMLLTLYIPAVCVFVYNYLIHAAYHIENHWLNNYEWFRQDKRIHFAHHDNPECNYGIATHYSDIIFDTFDYGFPVNRLKD